jgi:hypothetical protein
MADKPPVTATHKKVNLSYAINHVQWKSEWDKIVFSDKKKFNLDGSDGFHYYWNDLISDKAMIFSKRVQSGGFVMIGQAFSA